jgi:hypothetical protein
MWHYVYILLQTLLAAHQFNRINLQQQMRSATFR